MHEEDVADEDDTKDDADDTEDDEDADDDADAANDGGDGPMISGVAGADCIQDLLSAACASASSNLFGLDALSSDVRDTVEPVSLLGVSHGGGDNVDDLDEGSPSGTICVALGNKE